MPFPFSSFFPQKKRYYHPDFGYIEPRDFHRYSYRADFHPTGYYGTVGALQGDDFHAQQHQAREMQREQQQEYQRQQHEMERQQEREHRRDMAREQREMDHAYRRATRDRGRRSHRVPEHGYEGPEYSYVMGG
ncbi:uncharacterized protein BDZ99DRAFT_468975 [Mytilinidion resinicola]|uniref:Uncharacterized protein n=1 Tax=Mytilinidion resinicola TaxID=574789 RepID=A0A6A6Y1Z2_9PEZI|nr:uncharacterized protein BDZ99DRAFT_468975 [Mytilinidion resinicola]KAF2802533.1 hypothetical protein BDZ99DRAFT_468975 [Mytilinidion resinicola]